jgi:ankyrin repeat protein
MPRARETPWNDSLWSVVLHSGAFVPALGASDTARLARVSRAARREFEETPETLWGSMFAGQSRDELERLFWLALRAGETAHVALAMRAARDFGAGDFRAELLLLRDNNQQNEDEGCLYACAMSNDVATAQVLVPAALEAGVLQELLLLLNMGRSCLLPCVRDGHAEMLEVLLAGAAAAPRVEGELPCLRQLLELPADDDEDNDNGGSCLHFAAVSGDLRTMEVLLNAGRLSGAIHALLEARDGRDRTCLHWAASTGGARQVQMLLEAGRAAGVQRDLLNARNEDSDTCLHMAVDHGNTEAVRALLLVGGAALALVDGENGNTALHLAVWSGDLAIIRMLIDVGGRELLLCVDDMRRSCVHVSAGQSICYSESGQRSLLPVVYTLLAWALRLDNSVLGAVLLLRDEEGNSCLMTATSNRHSGVMRALLGYARRAGVEQQLLMMTSDSDESCLEYAVEQSDEVGWHFERQAAQVLAALLDGPFARELVTRQNRAGCTALCCAVTFGDAHAVRALLAAPGGLEALRLDGEWCLGDAIREGNLDVAGILREALFPVTKTE